MHLWEALGIGVATAVIGLVAVMLARRGSSTRDLGAMSGSWLTEHRASGPKHLGR